jgi:glycosyltransferase involved in cell wall biosynthesis
VGTIEPRKNVPGLLRAYAELLARMPIAPDLVLAGRIPPEANLMKALAARPLAGRVRAVGYVSDDTRERLYREASLLVLPSFEEGFGITALEAMTLGVPVVAARRGALPEVAGDAALLVDPEDHSALADAMEHVLSDGAARRRMAEAGVRRASRFTWDGSASRLYDAYLAAVRFRRSR